MQENITKSKHILFKYQTIDELIQGTGYKPSLKVLAVITPDMTVDCLIQQLMEINEITLACEVMVYALHPRARIWWGCSIIKSLHEEIFAKPEGKEGAKPDGKTAPKAPKEKAEAVALPKNKEEANEMLSQKVGEQKEALGLPQDKKGEASNASANDSEKTKLTPEEKKELLEKLKAYNEEQHAEQQALFEKEFKETEKQRQEVFKKIDETIASFSPEDKAFYDECQKKIDQHFKKNTGMNQQELLDFSKNIINKAIEADKSDNPADGQAVLKELMTVLSNNTDNIEKMFDKMIKIQEEIEQKQGKKSSTNKAETTTTEEKPKKDIAALLKEKEAEKEKEREEIQKAQKIKEVEEKTANLENNLRKKAYEAAVEWVNAPTKPNTLKVEKFSNEASSYPEGMLCLASFWSYGDFNITSDSQKNNQDPEKKKQPETIIRVDPSLPPKGIYSTLLMSALHEGGTRKPIERFVLYYNMGEKIACGKDNWTSEKIEPKQEELAAVPEKQEEKTEEKPSYTKWKM